MHSMYVDRDTNINAETGWLIDNFWHDIEKNINIEYKMQCHKAHKIQNEKQKTNKFTINKYKIYTNIRMYVCTHTFVP